jgi:hypothetical protein
MGGAPMRIEFISQALKNRCVYKQVAVNWIKTNKPTKNAYLERLDATKELNAKTINSLSQICRTVYTRLVVVQFKTPSSSVEVYNSGKY